MTDAEAGEAMSFDYLETFAAGDMRVVTEVLDLYREQAQKWQAALDPPGADWRDVVHTIKGAARGIGAVKLGDIAERAEKEGETAIPEVRRCLTATLAAVEGYLTRIGGG